MPVNNEVVLNHLEKIAASIKDVLNAQDNSAQLPALRRQLQQEFEQLKSAMPDFKAENITYEFCQENSNIIEGITSLRLAEAPLRAAFNEVGLTSVFNEYVQAMKNTLYQHPDLAGQALQPLPSGSSLEAAMARAELATKYSSAAAAAAEKLTQEGVQQVEDMQSLQRRGSPLNESAFNQSVAHTLKMYLYNTAAVIAADEAAAAIADLEEIIKLSSNP